MIGSRSCSRASVTWGKSTASASNQMQFHLHCSHHDGFHCHRERVTEELRCMETMEVTSRVDVPTPWCVGMVVALKKTGGVRICVDLKLLN